MANKQSIYWKIRGQIPTDLMGFFSPKEKLELAFIIEISDRDMNLCKPVHLVFLKTLRQYSRILVVQLVCSK